MASTTITTLRGAESRRHQRDMEIPDSRYGQAGAAEVSRVVQ